MEQFTVLEPATKIGHVLGMLCTRSAPASETAPQGRVSGWIQAEAAQLAAGKIRRNVLRKNSLICKIFGVRLHTVQRVNLQRGCNNARYQIRFFEACRDHFVVPRDHRIRKKGMTFTSIFSAAEKGNCAFFLDQIGGCKWQISCRKMK